jgi:hypothetical protein
MAQLFTQGSITTAILSQIDGVVLTQCCDLVEKRARTSRSEGLSLVITQQPELILIPACIAR